MTKDEIIVELEKLGIDFEITAEHDDGIHLVVKFDHFGGRTEGIGFNNKRQHLDGHIELIVFCFVLGGERWCHSQRSRVHP